MRIILGVLAVIVLISALSFIVHLLWIAALILLTIWFVGFVVSRSHPEHRWYRW